VAATLVISLSEVWHQKLATRDHKKGYKMAKNDVSFPQLDVIEFHVKKRVVLLPFESAHGQRPRAQNFKKGIAK
jgi:hypothetical protein